MLRHRLTANRAEAKNDATTAVNDKNNNIIAI
jgi:hypothetical protein